MLTLPLAGVDRRCGHCKRLAPEYETAATALKANDPPVTLIKVSFSVLPLCHVVVTRTQALRWATSLLCTIIGWLLHFIHSPPTPEPSGLLVVYFRLRLDSRVVFQ